MATNNTEGGRGRQSGGGGGGRGRGRGRGRTDNGGGRGRADYNDGGGRSGGGGGRSSNYGNNKQDRRASRRQKQLDAMSRKAEEEDAFFRQCQREAAAAARNNNNNTSSQSVKHEVRPKDDTRKDREAELFGKQIVEGINFNKYNAIHVDVKLPTTTAATATPPPIMEDFSKLAQLTPQLKRNIEFMKYIHPTPIQKHAIPLAMAGEDLMCCAQTGSGKTCAFLLPVIAELLVGQQQQQQQQQGAATQNNNNSNEGSNKEPAKPKCVILAPTRELASQIELEAEKLTHAIPSIQPVVVYGGANARAQLKELAYASAYASAAANNNNNNGAPTVDLLVVATPGRLTDFVDRNLVSLSDVKYLILDEADRCLDMGFEPQIRKLVQQSGMTPKDKRQTFLFSATFPPTIQTLAAEFLRPYVWIAIGRVGSTTDSITQVLVKATADNRHKLELVVDAMEKGPDGRTLIFVQKKRTATWLKKQLNKGGPDAGPKRKGGGDPQDDDHNRRNQKQKQPFQGREIRFTPIQAEEIHGDRSQSQREAALEKFRSGKCTVLVATDVAARGLDIPGVEHVINMDLPHAEDDFDSYVHRIGRTGRAGHEGLATSLFVPGDDVKSANGRIAGLLVAQLKEANQVVPSWLEDLVAGGGGGGGGNRSNKPQFGGTDVRKNSSSRTSNANKNSNDGGGGRGRGRDGRGGRGRGPGEQSNDNQAKESDAMSGGNSDRAVEPLGASDGGRGGRGRGPGGRNNDNQAKQTNGTSGGRNPGHGTASGRGPLGGRGGRGRGPGEGNNDNQEKQADAAPGGNSDHGVEPFEASDSGRGGRGRGPGGRKNDNQAKQADGTPGGKNRGRGRDSGRGPAAGRGRGRGPGERNNDNQEKQADATPGGNSDGGADPLAPSDSGRGGRGRGHGGRNNDNQAKQADGTSGGKNRGRGGDSGRGPAAGRGGRGRGPGGRNNDNQEKQADGASGGTPGGGGGHGGGTMASSDGGQEKQPTTGGRGGSRGGRGRGRGRGGRGRRGGREGQE